jgi:hypothetical protein
MYQRRSDVLHTGASGMSCIACTATLLMTADASSDPFEGPADASADRAGLVAQRHLTCSSGSASRAGDAVAQVAVPRGERTRACRPATYPQSLSRLSLPAKVDRGQRQFQD